MMQRIFSMEEFINIFALKWGVYQTMVIYINENSKSYFDKWGGCYKNIQIWIWQENFFYLINAQLCNLPNSTF